MTARGLLLALALLAASPVDAAHGRCYSVWHYAFPQPCHVAHARAQTALLKSLGRGPSGPDIPLPILTRNDCKGGEADELTRGRLMLRAALENANGH